MRAFVPAVAAALAAAAPLAQQVPPADGSQTVPQSGYETVTQPRFVRVPAEGGSIEVSPLAPPGGQDEQGGARFIVPEGEAGQQPLAETGEASGEGETVRQSRFNRTPSAPALAEPAGPAVPIDVPSTDLRRGVRLRELDKMTGQTETFEIAVGETRKVDRLQIRLEACRSPGDNDTHGTIAFLKVWDERQPEEAVFSGWMFAESPSLSAMDHPRYDLWVISCTTSAVAESSASE